jgi:hypothetical protein
VAQGLFSHRHGVGTRGKAVPYNRVPKSARKRLATLVEHRSRSTYRERGPLPSFPELYREVYLALGKRPEVLNEASWEQVVYAKLSVQSLIMTSRWEQFYNICDVLLEFCSGGQGERFREELDALFLEEGLPYEVVGWKIEWRGGIPLFREAITSALGLLKSGPGLAGPAEQLAKALEHLNRRPPDAENCVKDAVGALEGAARILSDEPKRTLGPLLRSLATRLKVHPALAEAMSSVYGYSSDEEAVRHGATTALKGPVEEAELVLHWCAASIVYLVRKRDALKG